MGTVILIDRYAARINLHGATQRERMKNRTIQNLTRKAPDSLSYKDVLINGVESQLVIDSGTQPYYKEFKTLPGGEINIGDYVEWAGSHWIVETCDFDGEIYRDGKMNQCNYLLKWQNEHGRIIERWAFIQSASKYNDGTDGNNVVTLGSDQLSVMIPVDRESLKLRKQHNMKFFIDNNKEDPTTYELTGTGNVVDTFNRHGVTAWIVKECAYTPGEDDLKFGVCNYKTQEEIARLKFNKSTPLPTVIINGKNEIKTGFYRIYKADIIGDNNYKIQWKVISDYDVQQEISGNQIKLQIDDKNAIGNSIKLQCLINNTVVSESTILVAAGF